MSSNIENPLNAKQNSEEHCQPTPTSPESAQLVAPCNDTNTPAADAYQTAQTLKSMIHVHRKPYLPQYSDTESDSEDLTDDGSEPGFSESQQSPNSRSIGDFVNVGHNNWVALRQEWKRRPTDWTPKRGVTLDAQTICDRISATGVLSERSDEGVPLPDVVRVMVQVWEREGVENPSSAPVLPAPRSRFGFYS